MSPQKYLSTFDRLLPLLKKKYRGQSTRIDFQKPRGRDSDHLVLAKRPFNDSRPDQLAIDDALRRIRLKPLGHQWQLVSRPAALQHLSSALHANLVFQIERLPLADAQQIATTFLNLLPSARPYTNGLLPPPKPKPYSTSSARIHPPNITSSLLDTGLVLINDIHILLLWLEDND